MKAAINSFDPGAEFHTPEQCHIIELANTPDDPEVSIARARVAPGVTTRWHRLSGTAERYVIIAGTARVEIGGLPPQDVAAGDVVLIPAMCPQRITNTGREDLLFLAICTPRYRQDAYEDIDDAPMPS